MLGTEKRQRLFFIRLGFGSALTLILFSIGCSSSRKGENSGTEVKRISYLNAGFLPERQTVLVSWLPLTTLPPGFKGYALYRTPPYAIGTNLTAPATWSPIGTVTQTSFEDRQIQGNKSYGYAVAVTYLDGHEDPLSPWIWVDIPVTYVTVPPESPVYNDPCSEPAHTQSSYSVVPLDSALNPVSRAVGTNPLEVQRKIKLEFGGYFFSPVTPDLYYYRYNHFEDIPQTLDLVRFSMSAASCTTIIHEFTLNEINDNRYYLYRFGYKLSERRFYYISFPNLNSMEWVYLDLSSPPLGAVLATGYHTFAGWISYRVRSRETRQLNLFVKGSDISGDEQYLAIFPLILGNLEDTLTVSGGFTIPEEITEVRFLAAFTGSTPDSLMFFDEIHYHVVP